MPGSQIISLQLQQSGDENGHLPGRHRPARWRKPCLLGWLLIGSDSRSQRTARVAPWHNVEISPHPGRIGIISGSEIRPYLYNSNEPGTKTQIPRVDTAPRGVETPTQLAGC